MAKRKRGYTSLHDISPRDYMYFPKGTLEMGRPGKFSKLEITHLLIAVAILTTAFAFPLSGSKLLLGTLNINGLIESLPIALLGIITAFFVHELAHKFMAQKYGLWSEFRMFPKGLIISLLLAVFTGIVFAAPGAVMFRGKTRKFEIGRISTAGVLANIIIALILFPLYLFVFFEIESHAKIVGFVCLVNALLATFNLLPFGGLDGAKVIRWNGIIWAILFSIALLITIAILPRFSFPLLG